MVRERRLGPPALVGPTIFSIIRKNVGPNPGHVHRVQRSSRLSGRTLDHDPGGAFRLFRRSGPLGSERPHPRPSQFKAVPKANHQTMRGRATPAAELNATAGWTRPTDPTCDNLTIAVVVGLTVRECSLTSRSRRVMESIVISPAPPWPSRR